MIVLIKVAVMYYSEEGKKNHLSIICIRNFQNKISDFNSITRHEKKFEDVYSNQKRGGAEKLSMLEKKLEQFIRQRTEQYLKMFIPDASRMGNVRYSL